MEEKIKFKAHGFVKPTIEHAGKLLKKGFPACNYFVTCLVFKPAFLKSFLYFFTCLDGTFTLRLDFVPLNACFPTERSFVDLIVTFFSFLHPLNEFFPIVVRFYFDVLPIVTVFSLVQPAKALAPIDFTLDPIVRVVIFLLFCIAFEPIEVTL